MGSPHTLDDPLHPQEPTSPADHAAAAAADDLFRRANPDRAQLGVDLDPLRRRELVRVVEDLEAGGYRVWYHQTLENPPTPVDYRHHVVRQRAVAAQLSAPEAERAFDRLNPEFGVPADHRDPLGQQAMRDREAALSLGIRVAVHDSRQNDRDPVIWQAGQDYRVADAIHRARTQTVYVWRPVERVGAER